MIYYQLSQFHFCSDDDQQQNKINKNGKHVCHLDLQKVFTIHCVQECTLSKLIIYLEDTERPGVTYTAFSRATSLDSILLLPSSGNDRLI